MNTIYTVLVFACFSSDICMKIHWKEAFINKAHCNDTLPLIYAQLVDNNLKIINILCIKEGIHNVKS